MCLVRDDQDKETICQGKGIGFGKNKGDLIDASLIERKYVPESNLERAHFLELFSQISDEYWDITERVLDYAKQQVNLTFKQTILLPLCDHMAGSVERAKQGVQLSNPMLYDIQRVYPSEFKVGQYALQLLKDKFDIEIKDDEAAFLAYHFVNSSLDNKDHINPDEYAKLITDVIDIVEGSFQITLHTEDWNYQRFLTHLKFFASRVFRRQGASESDDNELYQQMKASFPRIEKCVERVSDYILIDHHYEISPDERLYLLIHIERITKRYRQK